MPNSIRGFDTTDVEAGRDVQSTTTLGELLGCVPTPFNPRTAEVVNKVYRCAVKANHVRAYLSTLEKHKQDKTFPSEIMGRIQQPVFQISKEYEATATWKASKTALEEACRTNRTAALDEAILIKKAELSHLQKICREDSFKSEMTLILKEVTAELMSDAGVALSADGTADEKTVPEFLARDYQIFKQCKDLYPSRALALAFMVVQRENVSKMRALSLKKDADGDTEMADKPEKSDTVAKLVEDEIKRLQKTGKIPSAQKLTKNLSQKGRVGKNNKRTPNPKPRKGNTPQANQGKGNGKGNGKKKSQKK